MTDPVDTDAVRELSTWLYDESHWDKSQLASAAANEMDRLRLMELTFDGAVAEQERLEKENRVLLAQVRKNRRDGSHHPNCDKNSGRRYARCTCWKSRA